jgi:hypothetical protein
MSRGLPPAVEPVPVDKCDCDGNGSVAIHCRALPSRLARRRRMDRQRMNAGLQLAG